MMRCLLSIIIFLFSYTLFAQSGGVTSFNSNIHNFNTIKEADGKVYYDFVFINKGKEPVIIKKVKSTCGCMSPDWTKRPVLPGKKGFVRAIFDPTNRPGNFDKTISVYTNSRKRIHVLRIRGKVIPKKRTVLDDYPYELPCGLRMVYDHISFRSIDENKSRKIEIPVYNNQGKRLDIKFYGIPPFLKIKMVPEILDVKAKGKIVAEYDAKEKRLLGLVKDNIVFFANGEEQEMLVSANIKQDFSNLSAEQREMSPVISIDKKYVNFGNIERGEIIDFAFNIRNKGKDDLLIKRLYSYNENVSFCLPEKQIEAKESVELKISLNTLNLHGKQKILIRLICNDSLNSEIIIRLSGFVN